MRTKTISLDVFGDRYPWERYNYSAGDNSAAVCSLKKAMLAAVDTELTDSQRRIIYASYFEGKIGCAISNNAGPQMFGIFFLGEDNHLYDDIL